MLICYVVWFVVFLICGVDFVWCFVLGLPDWFGRCFLVGCTDRLVDSHWLFVCWLLVLVFAFDWLVSVVFMLFACVLLRLRRLG